MATHRVISPESSASRVRFRDVLHNRTFLVLYLAETQSIIGDQLARVALSIFVFARTNSAATTAATYAATFLPAVVGGALLSGLADRYPRRTVMVLCDLVRAALFGVMAIPGVPLPIVVTALVIAVLAQPAFTAAEVSLLANALTGEAYRVANGLRQMTSQIGQVGGFAVGGLIVAAVHPRPALAIDALTFFVSSLLIALGVKATTARAGDRPAAAATRSLAALRRVVSDPTLRTLFAFSWLAGFFVVPEGLAAPYAASVGASTAAVGFLLAAIPLGSVLGAIFVVRSKGTSRRSSFIAGMAILTGLPLIATPVAPNVATACALWFVSGFFAAYQIEVLTAVVHDTPDSFRARAYGLLVAGLVGAQGLGLLAFGAVAHWVSADHTVALAGIVGSSIAMAVAVLGKRQSAGTTLNVAPRHARSSSSARERSDRR